MPKAVDPEIVEQARYLVNEAGCSMREAAKTLGVTATTIKRWLELPAPPPASEPPAPRPVPAHMQPPPPIAPLDTSDNKAMVSQLITDLHGMIQADRQAGNARGAASMAATVAKLSTLLKQLDAMDRDAGDGVTISSAEVARIESSLAERIKANCNRPLLCDACSRALSVKWGTGLSEAELNAYHDSEVTPKQPGEKL